MEHTRARKLIAAGEETEEVRHHLEGCRTCRAFAQEVGAVVGAAPALGAAPPPAGLADRVIEHVRSSGRGDVAAPVPTLQRWRRPLVAAVSVAAAAALVAGILVASPSPSPADTLALAAERTAAVTTARVTFEGEAESTLRFPELTLPDIPEPELPELPELAPLPTPDLSGLPPEARRRAEDSFAQMRQRMETARERAGNIAFPEPPRIDLPEEVHVRTSFTGSGELVLPDRMHVAGTVRVEESSPRLDPEETPYELVIVEDRGWIRLPDGRWARSDVVAGPFGPLVLEADGVASMLASPRGPVEDLGTETVDGTRVRHLRFTPRDVVDAPATTTADVWIGVDDHVVRRLTVQSRSEAGPASWRTTGTLRIHDLGADVSVSPPPAEQVVTTLVPPTGSAVVMYPFGMHVHLALSGRP